MVARDRPGSKDIMSTRSPVVRGEIEKKPGVTHKKTTAETAKVCLFIYYLLLLHALACLAPRARLKACVVCVYVSWWLVFRLCAIEHELERWSVGGVSARASNGVCTGWVFGALRCGSVSLGSPSAVYSVAAFTNDLLHRAIVCASPIEWHVKVGRVIFMQITISKFQILCHREMFTRSLQRLK